MTVRSKKIPLAITTDPSTYLLEVCSYVVKVTSLSLDDSLWACPGDLIEIHLLLPIPHVRCFSVALPHQNTIEYP